MKWYVVYRTSTFGLVTPCALFLFHDDGEEYVKQHNLLEPGTYRGQLEEREVAI